MEEGISTYHFVAPSWRKEFKPIILSLQVGGRNLSLSFYRSKLEERISAHHFVAPSWRKVSSHNVFSLRIGGRFHRLMFSRSELEEGFIAWCFIAPRWRKLSSPDVFSLRVGGRFHRMMFSRSKLEEGFIAWCFAHKYSWHELYFIWRMDKSLSFMPWVAQPKTKLKPELPFNKFLSESYCWILMLVFNLIL